MSDIGDRKVDLFRRGLQILSLQGSERQERLYRSHHACRISPGLATGFLLDGDMAEGDEHECSTMCLNLDVSNSLLQDPGYPHDTTNKFFNVAPIL